MPDCGFNRILSAGSYMIFHKKKVITSSFYIELREFINSKLTINIDKCIIIMILKRGIL